MDDILATFIGILDAAFRRRLRAVGVSEGMDALTLSQLRYLEAVGVLSETTTTALAAQLAVTKASVTAGVAKLVRRGYVEKTRSDEDRRVYYLQLTDLGKLLYDQKQQTLKTYSDQIRALLSPDEVRDFERLLRKLVAELGET